MGGMFWHCANFNSNISDWDVKNVEYMTYMFYGCKEFNQYLDQWDTKNLKYKANMFNNCNSLENIPSWYNE